MSMEYYPIVTTGCLIPDDTVAPWLFRAHARQNQELPETMDVSDEEFAQKIANRNPELVALGWVGGDIWELLDVVDSLGLDYCWASDFYGSVYPLDEEHMVPNSSADVDYYALMSDGSTLPILFSPAFERDFSKEYPDFDTFVKKFRNYIDADFEIFPADFDFHGKFYSVFGVQLM